LNTAFFLTYGVNHRTSFFNSKPYFSENFASDLTGRMKMDRQIANNPLFRTQTQMENLMRTLIKTMTEIEKWDKLFTPESNNIAN
jgi:hypothetical protein